MRPHAGSTTHQPRPRSAATIIVGVDLRPAAAPSGWASGAGPSVGRPAGGASAQAEGGAPDPPSPIWPRPGPERPAGRCPARRPQPPPSRRRAAASAVRQWRPGRRPCGADAPAPPGTTGGGARIRDSPAPSRPQAPPAERRQRQSATDGVLEVRWPGRPQRMAEFSRRPGSPADQRRISKSHLGPWPGARSRPLLRRQVDEQHRHRGCGFAPPGSPRRPPPRSAPSSSLSRTGQPLTEQVLAPGCCSLVSAWARPGKKPLKPHARPLGLHRHRIVGEVTAKDGGQPGAPGVQEVALGGGDLDRRPARRRRRLKPISGWAMASRRTTSRPPASRSARSALQEI